MYDFFIQYQVCGFGIILLHQEQLAGIDIYLITRSFPSNPVVFSPRASMKTESIDSRIFYSVIDQFRLSPVLNKAALVSRMLSSKSLRLCCGVCPFLSIELERLHFLQTTISPSVNADHLIALRAILYLTAAFSSTASLTSFYQNGACSQFGGFTGSSTCISIN